MKAETIQNSKKNYRITLSWTCGKEKMSQHTSGFQKKKKIELHQNKNQFTEKDMWKGNPQMNKIFTVHISEKPHAAINREKQKAH